MAVKIVAGLISIGLLLMFLAPPVVKLRDGALFAVVAIGFVMMLVDLWQSLRSGDD